MATVPVSDAVSGEDAAHSSLTLKGEKMGGNSKCLFIGAGCTPASNSSLGAVGCAWCLLGNAGHRIDRENQGLEKRLEKFQPSQGKVGLEPEPSTS